MRASAHVIRHLSTAVRIAVAVAVTITAIGLFGRDARAIPMQGRPMVEAAINRQGILFISWTGPVVPGMSEYLRTTFEKHASTSHRVILHLDSIGGDVFEGERVIQVLQRIKKTHRLITIVSHGDICASMCVPIYLQGSE